ncbi:hypothetical protein [Clostridium sp.]|jgi:thiosulfate dehydrogenase [quinone] large subunit|uniref:hypothetical protein n=1 Tax=Clostridium sp. TaxID=1506 RepID=UPI003EE94273
MVILTIIVFICNIFAFLIILRQPHTVRNHGKIIINANKNKNRFLTVFFAGVVIILCCISGYLQYTRNGDIFYILLTILWIETEIFYIIKGLHVSEIREEGIYASGNFYEWSKVQSYSWVLPTTIQFKVNTFFIAKCDFEFTIKKELKSKANETLQKYVL